MCLPPPVLMLAAGGISAMASFQQGQALDRQAEMEIEIADRNAKMQELQGRYEARQLERKLRYTQGKATVQAGANGIGLDGSFLDIISDNEVQGEIDMENARRNARNRAESTRFEGRSAAARTRAKADSTRFGAIGGLIGSAGRYMEATA